MVQRSEHRQRRLTIAAREIGRAIDEGKSDDEIQHVIALVPKAQADQEWLAGFAAGYRASRQLPRAG
jgi:hypothetical protein